MNNTQKQFSYIPKDAAYFLEESQYMSLEHFQNARIKATDDYNTCVEKIYSVTRYYSSDSIHPWEYFTSIYNDIPIPYRIPLMLDAIYTYYSVCYPEMLEYIYNYINYEETSELKEKRLANNKLLIKNRVRKDGKIKVYRGLAENSIAPEYAVSFTLDKKVADFFVEYHKSRHGSRFGTTICSLVDIEDILF